MTEGCQLGDTEALTSAASGSTAQSAFQGMEGSPGVVEAGVGLGADLAAAALRFAAAESSRSGDQPAMPALLDYLEEQRGLRAGPNPRHAPPQASDRVGGWPPEPTSAYRAHAAVLESISAEADGRKSKLLLSRAALEAREADADPGWTTRCSTDFRRTQCFCLSLMLVCIGAWSVARGAMQRRRGCEDLNSDEHLSQCFDARDLQETLVAGGSAGSCDWSDVGVYNRPYRCAVPWTLASGRERCAECGCGGVCDHCTECVCVFAGAHHQCRAYRYYPGSWAETVLWVLVAAAVGCFGFFGVRVAVAGRIHEQKGTRDREADAAIREHHRLITDIELLERDLRKARLGSDGWKEQEPDRAFARRMRAKLGTYDYERLRAGGGGGGSCGGPTRSEDLAAGWDRSIAGVGSVEEDVRRHERTQVRRGSIPAAVSAEADAVFDHVSSSGPATRSRLARAVCDAAAAADGVSSADAERLGEMLTEHESGSEIVSAAAFRREFAAMMRTVEAHGSTLTASRRGRRRFDRPASPSPSPQRCPPPGVGGGIGSRLSGLLAAAGQMQRGGDSESFTSDTDTDFDPDAAEPAELAARAAPPLLAMLFGKQCPSPRASRQQSAAVRQALLLAGTLSGHGADSSPSPPRRGDSGSEAG